MIDRPMIDRLTAIIGPAMDQSGKRGMVFSLCALTLVGVAKTLDHLGVFAKYWQAGSVKTRLAATIGAENAAGLYREFVRQTLIRFQGTAGSASVWIWPPEKESEFSSVTGPHWQVACQPQGDLGRKMMTFFQTSLAYSGTSRVVLIGTDSPTLPRKIIHQAFEQLANSQCVLGPASDGGYYLIGLSEMINGLFLDMPWSSNRLFDDTRRFLEREKISWSRLPEWDDVDHYQDLLGLRDDLLELDDRNEHDRQLLEAINRFGFANLAE